MSLEQLLLALYFITQQPDHSNNGFLLQLLKTLDGVSSWQPFALFHKATCPSNPLMASTQTTSVSMQCLQEIGNNCTSLGVSGLKFVATFELTL